MTGRAKNSDCPHGYPSSHAEREDEIASAMVRDPDGAVEGNAFGTWDEKATKLHMPSHSCGGSAPIADFEDDLLVVDQADGSPVSSRARIDLDRWITMHRAPQTLYRAGIIGSGQHANHEWQPGTVAHKQRRSP